MTTTGSTADGQQETFSYDDAGNTTARTGGTRDQQLTWDAEGHLATLTEDGKTTAYRYDTDGNRLIARNADGSTTAYLPGGNELKAVGDTVTVTRYYSHGGQTIATRTTGGSFTFLFSDQHGTALIAVAWGAGQAVTRRKQLPFGSPRASSGTWPGDRGFLSGTTDPTGTTHLGAREYDPQLGRRQAAGHRRARRRLAHPSPVGAGPPQPGPPGRACLLPRPRARRHFRR